MTMLTRGDDLLFASIGEIAARYRAGTLSPVEITTRCPDKAVGTR